MAEYDFMAEPHQYCMDKLITGGRCCPDGLHRTDCKLIPSIEGHNKTLQKDRDENRPFPLREIIIASVVISLASFFGLSKINPPAPLCAPTPTCEISK